MTLLPLAPVLMAAALASPAQPAPTIEARLGSPDAATRRAAVEQVLARPEAVNPFDYALVSKALWVDGQRLQAAFWYYVFQARTRAWADLDKQGAGALRASLNDELGSVINRWLGSDLAAWQDVARRAITYEARLPLGPARPDSIAPEAWAAAMAEGRRSYREGFEQTLGRLTPNQLAAARRQAGLPVGPLEAPGPALPDSWR